MTNNISPEFGKQSAKDFVITKENAPELQKRLDDMLSGTPEANRHLYSVRDEKGGMDLFSKLLENRVLRLDGQVEGAMASVFISALFFLSKEAEGKEVTVMINSPGGSVIDGLAMYDAMRNHNADIKTVVSGMAASMGSILLAGGDTRLATPNARVMVHQPSGGGNGTSINNGVNQELIEQMRDDLVQIYVDHTGVPHKYWNELFDTNGDIWLSPEEAKIMGLVQGISKPAKPAPFAHMKATKDDLRCNYEESKNPVQKRKFEILKAVAAYRAANDNAFKSASAAPKSNTP